MVGEPLALEVGALGTLLRLTDGSLDGINEVLEDALDSKLGIKDGFELSVGDSEMVGTALLARKPGAEDG